MSAKEILNKIIALDEEILKLQDEFDGINEADREKSLLEAADAVLKDLKDDDFVPLSLIRIVEMMGTLDNAANILVSGLLNSNEEIRQIFGEALITIGNEDGIEAVIPAIDKVIENNDISTREMPYILGWIDDPGVIKQISRFFDNSDALVVYGAIEASVHIADPDFVEPLKKLTDDKRELPHEEDDDDDEVITIGMLAAEAISLIESGDDDFDENFDEKEE